MVWVDVLEECGGGLKYTRSEKRIPAMFFSAHLVCIHAASNVYTAQVKQTQWTFNGPQATPPLPRLTGSDTAYANYLFIFCCAGGNRSCRAFIHFIALLNHTDLYIFIKSASGKPLFCLICI